MPAIVRCLYKRGAADERLMIRDAHIKYMIANLPRLEQGGALVDSQGGVSGMFLILKDEDEKAALTFLQDEPYTKACLFESVTAERLERYVPNSDPLFLHKMLASAEEWIALQKTGGK
jgi:uncharacterized protein YciI